MKILVRSKNTFINPWTKNSMIGDEPVPVPYDNLCRSLLRDGSLERVEEKKTPLKIVKKDNLEK